VDTIEMDLGEVEWGGVDWISLAQDRDMESPFECGNEPLGSIKCWVTNEWLYYWWPPK
jgi:hypothetical protein